MQENYCIFTFIFFYFYIFIVGFNIFFIDLQLMFCVIYSCNYLFVSLLVNVFHLAHGNRQEKTLIHVYEYILAEPRGHL